ncbi:hypothetical protein MACJ_001085 [Theileria orientalis]|uniref:Uncharacterized protein n=1 Tax=Theileria orientalis TaxID=68886 RepID=A0A976QT48_THEOR|nr:hypothetical protein MACJ_001085 [Theileria orientalis]
MYNIRCKTLNLDSIVTFKRFYNPPTKKTWSKQNPLFKTPRPLVEPYNLGRLHPEKEWWNLPKKGLKPDTFMGFPDVANITKHGGSLYAHFMDGSTLSMVVYRCIEKNISDIDIWNKLTAQALKISISLDPYLLSILFLYFSLSCHYDYKFVATYVGRIVATLSEFGLEECSNVIMAMNNPRFYHEKTFGYVLRHSENLCLIGNLKVDESLRFLTSLKNLENPPQNCLIPIGELIEVIDLSIVDKTLVFDGLDSCCRLQNKVGILWVTKLYQESCNILESLKEHSHYFSLVFLNAVETYKFKNDELLHSTIRRIYENIHDATFEEQCRYIYLLSKLAVGAGKKGRPVTSRSLIANVLKIIGVFKKEVMKRFDELVKNDTLSFQVAIGTLNTNKELNPYELKLLEGMVDKLYNFKRQEIMELYLSLLNTRIELDHLGYVKDTVVKACWNTEWTDVHQLINLLDYGDSDHFDSVPEEKLDECFNLLSDQIADLNSDQTLVLIRFANRNSNWANKLLMKLVDHKRCLYNANIVVELINLYKKCDKEPDEFIYELLDGLCMKRYTMLSEDRVKLIEKLKENNIKHYSLEQL